MRCPTCRADVRLTLNRQCVECGDAEIVAWIERLRPEDGDRS